MSNLISFSMPTSIIIKATDGPTPSVLTVYEPTSVTPGVAIFTGASFTGYAPQRTDTAGTTGSSSNGLSVGAKAGVGVGVVAGVVFLTALLWFAYTMGKRRSRAAPSDPPEYDSFVHEARKQSKETLYSVDSSTPVEKASATDKAHATEKAYTNDAKV